MSQFWENLWTDGRTDGRTLLYRNLLTEAGSPKNDFYELWQQQKQLKTMEMSEAWPDIFWTHSQNSPAAAEAQSLKTSSHVTSLKFILSLIYTLFNVDNLQLLL